MEPSQKISIEKIAYGGWPNCYRLSNRLVDLIVTTDVGPRIIRIGFVGAHNEFKEFPDMLGKTGGNQWRIYGGHRLWHAPEENPRTYFPDNVPIKCEQHAGFVRLVQPVETTTGIQKEIDLRLSPGTAHVEVVHRLRNRNSGSLQLAPWAISVMAPGGVAIVPLPPASSSTSGLLPTASLSLWPYTDMTDSRWTWGKNFVLLRQDPGARNPQKFGAMTTDGWIAYARAGHLFVTKFAHAIGASYPDFGCSVEAYTNPDMLEVETLGPSVDLVPGAAVEHTEHWFMFRDVPQPRSETDVTKHVLPKVKAAQIS